MFTEVLKDSGNTFKAVLSAVKQSSGFLKYSDNTCEAQTGARCGLAIFFLVKCHTIYDKLSLQ